VDTSPQRIIVIEPNLLAAIREVYSRRPETYYLEPWELQIMLWMLGYTDDLAPEAEIAAAVEVVRTDFDLDKGAA
jgi:hypothetical protein